MPFTYTEREPERVVKNELTSVFVDFTVQEKAESHLTDNNLLENARSKMVEVTSLIIISDHA
jgi:hypothetical protein